MPTLHALLDIAPDAPGFLIPIFQPAPGANHLLVQDIGFDDRVIAFSEIDPPARSLVPFINDVETDVGDTAIWAFRHADGAVVTGPREEINGFLKAILKSKWLAEWPLVAMEVAGFCDGPIGHARFVNRAFERISAKSTTAAFVWLDTQIVTPAARRDVERAFLREGLEAPQEVIAQVVDARIEVYFAGASLANIDFVDTRTIAKALKIDEISVLRHRPEVFSTQSKGATWTLAALGGVGRFVLRNLGLETRSIPLAGGRSSDGDLAVGRFSADGSSGNELFIAIVQSDPRYLNAVITLLKVAPATALRHVIQIRPFGFDAPKRRRLSIADLSETTEQLDWIWIISQHRRSRPQTTPHRLSASNVASRVTGALVETLFEHRDLLPNPATGLPRIATSRLALVGVVSLKESRSLEDLLRQLLGAMLCEEAVLSSATRILAFVPGEPVSFAETTATMITLGDRTYNVEIVRRSRTDRSPRMVGWALDVMPLRDDGDYLGMCIGRLAAHGWTLIEKDTLSARLYDRDRHIQIWCALTIDKVWSQIERRGLGAGSEFLIVCRDAFMPDDQLRAAAMGVILAHSSDLDQWQVEVQDKAS